MVSKNMTSSKEVTIMLVEDDPGHARLIEKNLRRANVANDLKIATGGQLTLDYLVSEYASRERPSRLLVLLDPNMPVVDGFEVLERMKADERTKRIPVIVLTTADDRREAQRCYEPQPLHHEARGLLAVFGGDSEDRAVHFDCYGTKGGRV